MTDLNGWAGKILRVDLTSGAMVEEDTAPYIPFVGGRGLGLKVIWDEAPEVGAFDEENRLVLATGPLTGIPTPGAGRCTVISISPHTYPREQATSSSIGGFWGPELKFAGYDAVILQGRSLKPVYLWIHADRRGRPVTELRSAAELWGLDTFETQKALQRDLGSEAEVLCIGPAGENRVRSACLFHGTGHAAGQGGFGAVMGDKRLKAVAVHGVGSVRVADPVALTEALAHARRLVGTAAHWPLPSAPFWLYHQDPHDLSRQAYRTSYTLQRQSWILEEGYATVHKNSSCFGCPVACYNYLYMAKAGLYGGGDYNCVLWHLSPRNEMTWAAKQLCDRLGINDYEAQLYAEWAHYLHERGRLQELGPDLPPPTDPHGVFATALARKIAYREGAGAVLAEAMARAAEELGLFDELMVTEELRYGSHGMMDHWGPRDWGMVQDLVWAVENRDPNRHDRPGLSAGHYGWDPRGGIDWHEVALPIAEAHFGSARAISPQGLRGDYHPAQARFAAFIHKRSCLKDSLPLCDWQFPIYISPLKERQPPYCGDLSVESQLYSAITGHELDMAGLDRAGERIWNLQRALTMRQWRTANLREAHDRLPERFFMHTGEVETPIGRGEWDQARTDYYHELGWDTASGAPTRQALEALGLGGVAAELEGHGLLPLVDGEPGR
ncbi:MAG: hypothetical protein JXA74_12220 [Anaerolineae bacterium]|nr:hypothetical protein [Anaerolineae bacterium]